MIVIVLVSSLLALVLSFALRVYWLRTCERIAAAHPKHAAGIIRAAAGPLRGRPRRNREKT